MISNKFRRTLADNKVRNEKMWNTARLAAIKKREAELEQEKLKRAQEAAQPAQRAETEPREPTERELKNYEEYQFMQSIPVQPFEVQEMWNKTIKKAQDIQKEIDIEFNNVMAYAKELGWKPGSCPGCTRKSGQTQENTEQKSNTVDTNTTDRRQSYA